MKKSHALLSIVALVALITLPPIVATSTPLIVLSESMVPVMQMGDVVIIKSERAEDIKVGDILAFRDPGGRKNVVITHRVVGIEQIEGKPSFKTKGDAVEDPDHFSVKAENVVGRAIFLFPSIGYFFKYGKNPTAFLFLVLLPASLIIMDEFRKIVNYGNPLPRKKRREPRRIMNYDISRMLAILLFALIIFGAISLPCLFGSGYASKPELEGGLFPGIAAVKYEGDAAPQYIALSSGRTEIPGNAAMISMAPYIMPVFWLDLLANISAYLPSLVTFIVPPLLLTFLLLPAWRRPIFKRRVKRRRSWI